MFGKNENGKPIRLPLICREFFLHANLNTLLVNICFRIWTLGSTVTFVLWLLAARKSYGTFTTQTLALGPCIRNVYLSFNQFVIQSPFIHRLSSYCSLPNIGYTLCISLFWSRLGLLWRPFDSLTPSTIVYMQWHILESPKWIKRQH